MAGEEAPGTPEGVQEPLDLPSVSAWRAGSVAVANASSPGEGPASRASSVVIGGGDEVVVADRGIELKIGSNSSSSSGGGRSTSGTGAEGDKELGSGSGSDSDSESELASPSYRRNLQPGALVPAT